ncbi:MAG: DUF1893 domain-containing protein [Firmicutes bacterium]|nr:DUF1893 domain-containing protein [Bacillota bacterium]
MDLDMAIQELRKGSSVVVVKDGEIIARKKGRGISPFLEIIEDGRLKLKAASMADKVIGLAAAHLVLFSGIGAVYADVISERALTLLGKNKLRVVYKELTPNILNRDKNGICPMEDAVAQARSPEDAYCNIKKRLAQLRQG